MSIHKTVLLEEAVDGLNIEKGNLVVDATLGGGGHSMRILEKISCSGKLISIDRDEEAIVRFEKKISDLNIDSENVILVKSNFSDIGEILEKLKIEKVDAILADFGLSSDQLDDRSRGFSFSGEERLDMRMDKGQGLDAFRVVNEYSQEELERIIRDFGDEKFYRKIVKEIVARRKLSPIETTKDLLDIIEKSIPYKFRKGKINFSTKTFQAIRMEVNQELESIGKFLSESLNRLKKGGRLAVISFHSGEDRIVKNFFRDASVSCVCPVDFPVCCCGRIPEVKLITRKPIVPSDKEIQENPRSRSAKLRIVERI